MILRIYCQPLHLVFSRQPQLPRPPLLGAEPSVILQFKFKLLVSPSASLSGATPVKHILVELDY